MAGAVLLLLNLPFAALNPSGWRWTFTFQGARQASWGSAQFYLLRLIGASVHGASGSSLANTLSFVALAVGIGGLTLFALRRPMTAAGAAGAAVAMFLLVNKVYSPTYDLWLLAFFVLLPLSRRLWITFSAVDVLVFATVYGHFHWGVSSQVVHLVLPVAGRGPHVLVLVVFIAARRYGTQSVKKPPSGWSSSPVKYEASSDARKATVLAILGGLTEAPHRDRAHHGVLDAEVLDDRRHVGVDEAGAHRVHADALRRQRRRPPAS